MANGILVKDYHCKYKDVSIGTFSGNTWHNYYVGGDPDLADKVILGFFFVNFESNVYINTSAVYNANDKRIYYGASGNQTGSNCTLRILYDD